VSNISGPLSGARPEIQKGMLRLFGKLIQTMEPELLKQLVVIFQLIVNWAMARKLERIRTKRQKQLAIWQLVLTKLRFKLVTKLIRLLPQLDG